MFGRDGGVLTALLHVLSGVFSLVVAAVAFVLVLGLIALLVRFLWFGTRAAQVYLAKNGESPMFTWPVRPVRRPGQDAPDPDPGAGSVPRPATAAERPTPTTPGATDADLTVTRPYEQAPDAARRAAPADTSTTPGSAPKTPRKPKSPPSAS